MNKFYGIVVSLIASISTLIGYLFIYIKGKSEIIIIKSLSFASGVMLTLSIVDLLPEGLINLTKTYKYNTSILISFACFFIGFFISYFISNLVTDSNKLYKTGIITMIGIMLHNIPEGIATFILSSIDLKLGVIFAIGIILHNIPEGISISIPIYYSTKSRFKAFIYTFISGISEFLGAIIAYLFLHKFINTTIIGILFSLISGLMIYIGCFELLKLVMQYNKKKTAIAYSFFGMIFIIFAEIFLRY